MELEAIPEITDQARYNRVFTVWMNEGQPGPGVPEVKSRYEDTPCPCLDCDFKRYLTKEGRWTPGEDAKDTNTA